MGLSPNTMHTPSDHFYEQEENNKLKCSTAENKSSTEVQNVFSRLLSAQFAPIWGTCWWKENEERCAGRDLKRKNYILFSLITLLSPNVWFTTWRKLYQLRNKECQPVCTVDYLKGNYVILNKSQTLRQVIFTILVRSLYKLRNIYIFHSWINKLFSEENKVPEHCLELERWQGPPHVNKVKQYETVLSF